MPQHQELADFIKSVHIDLRLRSREVGPSAAWEEHCANKERLEKYAKTMHELASVHWERNNGESADLSRVFWVTKQIEWYFYGDGRTGFLVKEKTLAQKFSIEYDSKERLNDDAVSLLDVGSCYNPFSKFPNLSVFAIDLAPACEDVLKCDFLSVTIGDSLIVNNNNCTQLPSEYFDVVVFSLLLEYIPSPKQRFLCCQNASSVLKNRGLLIILTPDSKHDSANSRLTKMWRLALASIGFILLKTEKLKHLRCLVFVKSSNPVIPRKWLAIQKQIFSPEEAIVIPQDKNPYDNNVDKGEKRLIRSESDNKNLVESFSQLIAEEDLFV